MCARRHFDALVTASQLHEPDIAWFLTLRSSIHNPAVGQASNPWGLHACMGTFGNGARLGMAHCQVEFRLIRRACHSYSAELEYAWRRDYPDSCRSARLSYPVTNADTDPGFPRVLAARRLEPIAA
jgi:hypothetical protein